MNIHPYLLARLVAIREAFEQPGYVDAYATNLAMPAPTPKVEEEEEDEQGGGGGSTAKGLRGKNDVAAKAAMRRLTRNK